MVPPSQRPGLTATVEAHFEGSTKLNGGSRLLPGRQQKRKASTMRTYRIAAIPGDGIGKEVIPAGVEVLQALAERDGEFSFTVETLPWGSDYYRETGRFMPEDGVATLRGFDAIYFGAVGDPDIADHLTLWGLRLPICQGLDPYANVRPTRIPPGLTGPLRDCGPAALR